MKPRALKLLAGSIFVLWTLAAVPLAGQTTGSTPQVSPTPAAGKGGKNKKKDRDPNTPTPTPKPSKAPKEIPFVLPNGKQGQNISIPELDATGQILSKMFAARMNRLDNDHVQMEEMHLDFNQQKGKEEMHVVLPTSVFNLKTHLLTSESAVEVRTADFELTGEKMEFDTIERSGKLLGHVRMVIHNLKQVSGTQTPPGPKTE